MKAIESFENAFKLCWSFSALFCIVAAVERLINICVYWGATLWRDWINRRSLKACVTGFQKPTSQPKVVVQLPVCNEGDLVENVIDACCRFNWPRENLLIQVLDDSSDSITSDIIDRRVGYWQAENVNINCIRRKSRGFGFKAGNLNHGLKQVEGQGYRYVAIFDADFRPHPDFLTKTIPYFTNGAQQYRPTAFVQTNWTSRNANLNFLTKCQEIWTVYFRNCECYSRFLVGGFQQFCGSSGVVEIEALKSVGGWKEWSLNEDVELSLKLYAAGYTGVQLNDYSSTATFPETLQPYLSQQHRWLKSQIRDFLDLKHTIINSTSISFFRKLELFFLYFFNRRIFRELFGVNFFMICIMTPVAMIIGSDLLNWRFSTMICVYLPIIMSLLTTSLTEEGWRYFLPYLLFMNFRAPRRLLGALQGSTFP